MDCLAKEVLVLRKLHSELKSWAKVGDVLDLNCADCWRVAQFERGASPAVKAAIDFWLRCEMSSDPEFVRVLRKKILPWLAARDKFERKSHL